MYRYCDQNDVVTYSEQYHMLLYRMRPWCEQIKVVTYIKVCATSKFGIDTGHDRGAEGLQVACEQERLGFFDEVLRYVVVV